MKQVIHSYWRPSTGWVCVVGLAIAFVVAPIATIVCAIVAPDVKIPDISTEEIMPMLITVLGMGGIRSFDKVKGTAKDGTE